MTGKKKTQQRTDAGRTRESVGRDTPYEERQGMLDIYATDGRTATLRTPVKVVATSDLHGELYGLKNDIIDNNPDIVLLAGDIADSWDQERWMRDILFALVADFPHTQFVAVAGNHDFYAQRLQNAKYYGKCAEKDALKLPDNFRLLFDEEIELCGLRIYGTPWVNYINGQWVYELDCLDEGRQYFDAIPDGIDILVAHTPPLVRHATVDISMQRPNGSPHYGSRALTEAIERARPRLTVCGHIHSGDHKPFEVAQGAWCANVSRVDEQYQVAYAPLVAVV